MTNRDVALLAFKLLGLWLVASAAIGIAGLPYYWELQSEALRGMTVFFTVLPLLVAVGIGVLATLVLGVHPDPLLRLAHDAASQLFVR